MRNFFSFSNLTAGFVAVLVGFTSSGVIVFQAASVAGATPAETSSWIFALGVSIAVTCMGLSWFYKIPVLIGWSTPGAALLVTSLAGLTMPEAIGAFIFTAALTIIAGVTGIFAKTMAYIPRSLAAAMLAGILLHFGMDVFVAMQHQFVLVASMLFMYILGKRYFPRYVILLVLCLGVFLSVTEDLFTLNHFQFALAKPIWIMPKFSTAALISVGIPLFIVNMTSQNMPGVAVMQASGYKPSISSLVSWTGLANLLLAPFGCYSIGLAAITAAICTNKEADADPAMRYKATIFAGLCWLCIGIFGATVVTVFFAFPRELILAVAGLALFSTIGSSLQTALSEDKQREPAIITLLISASGISLFGIGAAFWGIVAGISASIVLNWQKRPLLVKRQPLIQ